MSVREETYKIFLSYPSSRASQVKYLSDFFESKGFTTWYAPRDIPAGSTWYEEIRLAIEDCDALVLIFCKKADESKYIGAEVNVAGENNKARFYLRVEDGVFPKNLSILIGPTQWRDWFDENDEAPLNEIVDVIRKKLDSVRKPESITVQQNDTGNILLSEPLARCAEKFAAFMNTASILKQLREGSLPLLSLPPAVPAVQENITHVKPFIFLSYPNVKAEAANNIADFLESRGFKAWYTSRDVQSGVKFYEEISAAIQKCNAFICIFCSESDKDEDSINELVFAIDNDKPIITVRIENFESKKRFSLYLGGRPYIDWFNTNDNKPLERLVSVLRQELSSESQYA